ncbi:MAG: hypothetical protein ACKPKO_22285 [Candidatus Fonsibacter sp.]
MVATIVYNNDFAPWGEHRVYGQRREAFDEYLELVDFRACPLFDSLFL